MTPVDRVAKKTAQRISRELDQMVAELSPADAPQLALELTVKELAALQPWFMRFIMEDPDFKESYWAAVADIPATAKRAGLK